MHLICLGIVKKLILLWVKGPRTVKLSQQLLNQISGALLNLQSSIPNDFVRRPRSLKDVKLWKGTECVKKRIKGGYVYQFHNITYCCNNSC